METKQLFLFIREKLTAKPTAPNPKTATVSPVWTSAVFHAAPRPASSIPFNSYALLAFIIKKQSLTH